MNPQGFSWMSQEGVTTQCTLPKHAVEFLRSAGFPISRKIGDFDDNQFLSILDL